MILYCNGPSCGKSKRTSEQLVALGYTNVRRYQLGMPVWRALSQTVQTDMLGLSYIYSGDKTAVFVDARTPAEFASATVPGAVNIQAGEATAANDDGRLPLQDKGTRVVVFGNTLEQSRIVAAEIAKKAYWNSSYFGGTLADLVQAGYVNHAPVAIARNVAVAAGPACTAAITPGAIDAGSFDPDVDDSVSLSIDPAGPLGLGDHVISLIATDSHGASSVSPATVTVADRSAPVVSDLSVDQPVLWPPDHRMETVTLRYVTSDNCGAVSTEIAVSSTDAGKPDAQSGESSDWRILDANHVSLRAERAGGGDRIYWISVIATDAAGNRSAGSLTVRVPASAR
jgi:rhodanese-related sulfurtransferase